jgi:hypothetical protein
MSGATCAGIMGGHAGMATEKVTAGVLNRRDSDVAERSSAR